MMSYMYTYKFNDVIIIIVYNIQAYCTIIIISKCALAFRKTPSRKLPRVASYTYSNVDV